MKQMAERLTGLAVGLIFTLLLFSLFMLFPRMAYYEGEYFPVVDNVVLEVVHEDENGVYVDAVFDKIRNCEFARLNWYKFSDKGELQRVPLKFIEDGDQGTVSRPVGLQRGNYWFIGVPRDQLPYTYAEAVHKCHPLWNTRTEFYP